MSNIRKMIATITVLFFTAAFGASTTIAADDTHKGDSGKHHMSHGKCNMMSKVDSNKDGKISKEEFLKYQEAKFEKKDLNKDGFIDKDEMDKMMKKHMHGHDQKNEMDDKTHGHGDMKE